MNDGETTEKGKRGVRRLLIPAVLFLLAASFVVAFFEIAAALFVAVLLVYLIEPIVARLSGLHVRGRSVPRWGAVIVVYSVLLGGTLTFVAVFAPRLAVEAGGMAAEVPRFVRTLRDDFVPQVNDRVNDLSRILASTQVTEAGPTGAAEEVGEALRRARAEAAFVAALTAEERDLYRSGLLTVDVADEINTGAPVLMRLRTNGAGEVEVIPGDEDLVVVPFGEGAWRILSADRAGEADPRSGLDLERAFADSLTRTLEASGEEVSEILQFSQRIVIRLVSAIVSIFVTLMIAAFISIDVPRLVVFFTGLFPEADRPAVRDLLGKLDRGLAGVIRGQVAICGINAVLTGIGLAIFNVKFAFLLACVAGVFSLIPIFGTILSSVPIVLVALSQGLSTVALVIAWIIGIHFIEANILNPKIVGSAARIHPVIVILALLAGEHAYGIVGALLAVPTASVIQSLFIFAREQYAAESPRPDGDPE